MADEVETCTCIGIDLGTSNSLVGVCKHGNGNAIHIELLTSMEGEKLIHSCVYHSKKTKEVLVGKPASAKKGSYPENTHYEFKRLMGMNFGNENVVNYRKSVPFSIVEVSGKPIFELTHNNEKILRSPEEMSALVLSKLRKIAEQKLAIRASTTPLNIANAVITVPAYFSMVQKDATKRAAKLAGFEECHLITEPAAAAYAYGFDQRRFDGYNILVFDFGGGTFDVAILEVNDGNFVQKGIDGDIHLGGRDLDLILRDYCAQEIKDRWERDCLSNKKTAQILLEKCETIKKDLSGSENESLYLNGIFAIEDEDVYLEISRVKLEELLLEPLEKAVDIVNRLLRKLNYTVEQINEILMVGGTSRIPLITELLLSKVGFTKEQINLGSMNPDEAVARGAAILAAQISKNSKFQLPMKLVEVLPLSLGIKSNEDIYEVIIPRIPIKITKDFYTGVNDQTSMRFEIREGERQIASKNNFLGSLLVEGLKKGKVGTVSVRLTMEIDQSGILRATAQHQGVETAMDMEYEPRNNPERDLDAAIRDARKNLSQDKAEKERLQARADLKLAIQRAEYKCANQSILQICEKFEQWLKTNQKAQTQSFKTKLTEFDQEIGEFNR